MVDTPLIPLITAAQVFPALERIAWEAEQDLFLSFRIFDPNTALRSPELLDQGLTDWKSLLRHISNRGVRIRMIVSDFDAIFTKELHRSAWTNAKGFADAMSGDCDILCAPHGQFVGSLWMWALRSKIRSKMADLRNDAPEVLTDLQKQILERGGRLRPVTLHQKFAVSDGCRAVIGGLDVNERRYDSPDHEREADKTWHDISAESSGPICQDIRAHFIDTWNRALDWQAPSLCDKGEHLPPAAPSQPNGDTRLVRTISMPRLTYSALGPDDHVTEHLDVLLKAFARARRHIYIETQFFRHRQLARTLADAGRRNPDLNLILLMPTEPERVIFDGDDGFDARLAQALQVRNLRQCHKAFGERMVAISPVQPRSTKPDEDGALEGAPIVYVHAKLTLIDDEWGMIGSANLNGRSMHWDTEASIAFDNPAVVQNLREELARKWLGDHFDQGDTTRASTWHKAAQANAALSPDNREGFVMPYPYERNRRFALFLPILPSKMF
ncbi:cardiolipin synthase [Roseovarius sp. PS-C2]|uniref:phospholipase D family protein n=1 Tax=Roseovarius sp. PS-C2 TaxID=2820814 RepID=UPI001C0E5F5F|nr:phospholipase D family protein [Roseovarius sp. PS-C2]MBU3261440.1 cardiolipin synthase [Roseovarius sp. PS-C2]